MPPHVTYIETHLGGGAILRIKKPAAVNIGIDIDSQVIEKWGQSPGENQRFYLDDALSFLRQYSFTGSELVYCDPPYLMETRKSGPLYRHEYTREQHIELLGIIKTLPCMVIISGYYSELYNEQLAGWNYKTFQAQTRGGTPATEYVWFNFKDPLFLHDPRFIGTDYRDRERIKKKADRWVNRFESLPLLEKQAIMACLKNNGVF
jgi:hypothetical protein